MRAAFDLIMTAFVECIHRAARDTLFTDSLREPETIGVMIAIRPWGRGDVDVCDHRAGAHGFTPRGNEPVTEAESSKAGSISGMPFRPGGGKYILFRFFPFPLVREHRRQGRISIFLQNCHPVFSKLNIDLFAENARAGPTFSRVGCLFSIVGLGRLGLRQDPADNGQVLRLYGRFLKCPGEYLPRRPVKRPDNLLVGFKKGVISPRKADQRRVKGLIIGFVLKRILR